MSTPSWLSNSSFTASAAPAPVAATSSPFGAAANSSLFGGASATTSLFGGAAAPTASAAAPSWLSNSSNAGGAAAAAGPPWLAGGGAASLSRQASQPSWLVSNNTTNAPANTAATTAPTSSSNSIGNAASTTVTPAAQATAAATASPAIQPAAASNTSNPSNSTNSNSTATVNTTTPAAAATAGTTATAAAVAQSNNNTNASAAATTPGSSSVNISNTTVSGSTTQPAAAASPAFSCSPSATSAAGTITINTFTTAATGPTESTAASSTSPTTTVTAGVTSNGSSGGSLLAVSPSTRTRSNSTSVEAGSSAPTVASIIAQASAPATTLQDAQQKLSSLLSVVNQLHTQNATLKQQLQSRGISPAVGEIAVSNSSAATPKNALQNRSIAGTGSINGAVTSSVLLEDQSMEELRQRVFLSEQKVQQLLLALKTCDDREKKLQDERNRLFDELRNGLSLRSGLKFVKKGYRTLLITLMLKDFIKDCRLRKTLLNMHQLLARVTDTFLEHLAAHIHPSSQVQSYLLAQDVTTHRSPQEQKFDLINRRKELEDLHRSRAPIAQLVDSFLQEMLRIQSLSSSTLDQLKQWKETAGAHFKATVELTNNANEIKAKFGKYKNESKRCQELVQERDTEINSLKKQLAEAVSSATAQERVRQSIEARKLEQQRREVEQLLQRSRALRRTIASLEATITGMERKKARLQKFGTEVEVVERHTGLGGGGFGNVLLAATELEQSEEPERKASPPRTVFPPTSPNHNKQLHITKDGITASYGRLKLTLPQVPIVKEPSKRPGLRDTAHSAPDTSEVNPPGVLGSRFGPSVGLRMFRRRLDTWQGHEADRKGDATYSKIYYRNASKMLATIGGTAWSDGVAADSAAQAKANKLRKHTMPHSCSHRHLSKHSESVDDTAVNSRTKPERTVESSEHAHTDRAAKQDRRAKKHQIWKPQPLQHSDHAHTAPVMADSQAATDSADSTVPASEQPSDSSYVDPSYSMYDSTSSTEHKQDDSAYYPAYTNDSYLPQTFSSPDLTTDYTSTDAVYTALAPTSWDYSSNSTASLPADAPAELQIQASVDRANAQLAALEARLGYQSATSSPQLATTTLPDKQPLAAGENAAAAAAAAEDEYGDDFD